MNVFELDATYVRSHTDALRNDAASLSPLSELPIPATGPLANFARATAGAIRCSNGKAEELQEACGDERADEDAQAEAAAQQGERAGTERQRHPRGAHAQALMRIQ